MINQTIQHIMDILIDEKGFFLEEFPSMEEDFNFYLYTKIRNGYLAVIFSSAGHEDENHLAFRNYAQKNGFKSYVLNVIFTSGNYGSLNPRLPNYSEAFVDSDGNLYNLDELGKSILMHSDAKVVKPKVSAMKLTLSLVLINSIIYILTAVASGSTDINILVLIQYGAKVNELIVYGEYWRLLTSAFLHADMLHILFNMYALYSLGKIVETELGGIRYLIIYFFSAITAGLLSFYLTPNIAVGASGAIFGLLGAILIMALFGKSKALKGMVRNILFILGLNLFIGFAGNSNIDNFGHIGGLLGGIFVASIFMLLDRQVKNRDENQR
ncbi:MAG: rhomboid family intramembrane serine protease [Clostridiaceae bacterium]